MISAIVVAAGKSSRTGDINKLLLPFRNSTIIGSVLETLKKSNVDEIILVLPPKNKIESSLKDCDRIKIVYNPAPDNGLTSSIQTGVETAHSSAAYLICLADMPMLGTEDFNYLINKYLNIINKVIVAPYKDNRRGNPVLFSNHFRNEILNENNANGCKPVILKNKESIHHVEVQSDAYFTDVDTLDQYKKVIGSK